MIYPKRYQWKIDVVRSAHEGRKIHEIRRELRVIHRRHDCNMGVATHDTKYPFMSILPGWCENSTDYSIRTGNTYMESNRTVLKRTLIGWSNWNPRELISRDPFGLAKWWPKIWGLTDPNRFILMTNLSTHNITLQRGSTLKALYPKTMGCGTWQRPKHNCVCLLQP